MHSTGVGHTSFLLFLLPHDEMHRAVAAAFAAAFPMTFRENGSPPVSHARAQLLVCLLNCCELLRALTLAAHAMLYSFSYGGTRSLTSRCPAMLSRCGSCHPISESDGELCC
jgi:predicted deacylase